jgi:prepilin peptidase CpaA
LLPQASSPAVIALAAGALTATVVDIRTRRIPNVLTGSMAAVGVGLAAAGWSGISVGASLAGLVAGLLLMLPGHALGATGAGDVKLMGAVGAVVGIHLIVNAFLFTALAGGVLAVVVATRRRRLGATLSGTSRLIASPAGARQEIRGAAKVSRFAYGPAIAIGSLVAALIG